MREFITSRFSLDVAKPDALTWGCLVIVWLVVLGCAISSVLTEHHSARGRAFWITVLVCFPVVGLLCYLPSSFNPKDYPIFFSIKK